MIIDFRARPNTKPYMTIQEPGHWTGPAGGTKGFGYDPGIGTLEEFIASLEANDIGKAVFTGRQIGTNDHLIAGITNDYIAECIARYPDKLIGFAGIDPTTGAAAPAELERAVKQLGLRGVSMDPDFVRLTPDDPTYYPIYEKAVELKIPVVL